MQKFQSEQLGVELCTAASRGNIEEARRLVDEGAAIDHMDKLRTNVIPQQLQKILLPIHKY